MKYADPIWTLLLLDGLMKVNCILITNFCALIIIYS